MKSCARCNSKAKSKILAACGLIRLCNHCRLFFYAWLGQRGIGPEPFHAD